MCVGGGGGGEGWHLSTRIKPTKVKDFYCLGRVEVNRIVS